MTGKKLKKISKYNTYFPNYPAFTTAQVRDGQVPEDVQVMRIISQSEMFIRGRMDVAGTPFVEIHANRRSLKNNDLPSKESVGLKDGCNLLVPKIPITLMEKVESFFRDVYEKYQSEAVVLLLHSLDGQWYCVAPTQIVSRGSVNYDWPDEPPPTGWYYVGSIHSHADFSAFHSGTDDDDEFDWDGIHITLGGTKNNRDHFNRSSAVSVMIDKTRFTVPVDSLVETSPATEYEEYWMGMVEKIIINIPSKNGKKSDQKTVSKKPVGQVQKQGELS